MIISEFESFSDQYNLDEDEGSVGQVLEVLEDTHSNYSSEVELPTGGIRACGGGA